MLTWYLKIPPASREIIEPVLRALYRFIAYGNEMKEAQQRTSNIISASIVANGSLPYLKKMTTHKPDNTDMNILSSFILEECVFEAEHNKVKVHVYL